MIKEEDGSLTIRISNRTKKRVEKLGRFGQSWDDLLNEMAQYIEEDQEEDEEEEEK